MLPVHTILHPTDFSDQSRAAMFLACALARDYNARLVALHAVPVSDIMYSEGSIPLDPETIVASEREALNQLQAPDAAVPLEKRLEQEDPVDAILRVAQDVGADLIVMGTHGRTGLTRLLMGSVAEQVVRKASCPVVTVKSPMPETAHQPHTAAAEAVPV